MDAVELTLEEYKRLMEAILWVLGPYLDENSISEHPHLLELGECYNDLHRKHPHLLELGECYNDLHRKQPKTQEYNYPELSLF